MRSHQFAFVTLFVSSLAMAVAPDPTGRYHYAGTNKRDPFRPFAIAAPTLQTLSRLQESDLKELKLVGTLLGNEMSALIITPKGEGIIARVGDKIGRAGRIVAIIQDKIIVRQPSGETGTAQRFEDITITLTRRNVESNNGQTKPVTPTRGGLNGQFGQGANGTFPQNNPNQNPAGLSSFVPPPLTTPSPTSANASPLLLSPTTDPNNATPPPAPAADAATPWQ